MTATGVHCSVRKGFVGALQEAVSLGCDTFQMFTQSPRGWRTRVYTDQEFRQFREERAKSKINPVIVHAPYLPNLCTSNDELYRKSLRALKDDLERCEKLGADYLVVHPGAYSPEADLEEGLRRIIAAVNEALKEVPGRSRLLIENMAGGGRRVGGPFRDLARMLDGINSKERIGVCLDTCHVIAAGYDIATEAGARATVKELSSEIGLDQIYVLHVNDSKTPRESHRDRHEHIGKGYVGLAGFRALFGAADFRGRAMVLETPKDPFPEADQKNLSALRLCLKDVYGQ